MNFGVFLIAIVVGAVVLAGIGYAIQEVDWDAVFEFFGNMFIGAIALAIAGVIILLLFLLYGTLFG